MTTPDQSTEAPSAADERRETLRGMMQAWSTARFTRKGHTPAARSLVADAGLELLDHIDALTAERDDARAALQTANARAAGYALLVGELMGHLVVVTDLGSAGGGWAEWECLVCHVTQFAAVGARPQIVHEPDCILAADPEARTHELLAAREEDDPDRCAPCQSKVYSGIGPFPWTCKNGHTVYCSGGPLTALNRLKPAQEDSQR